ncbi:MAG: ABC transporter substrate-binding protein [Clostridia bacterium]|nr:ABC transporter substrate-binding protein [Clostridia bacterium]
MSKKILAVVLAALMLVSVFAFAGCGNKSENNTIKIGLSGPLTGAASIYGVAVKNAAEMAVAEINEAGGLNGYDFELIATDDAHDSKKVAANYTSMLDEGMQVSLGCVTSNPCLEFCKLSLEDNVFFLTPSASNDDVPAEANAYQMCFADGNQGKVAAEYVNGLGYEEIGIFYKNDDSYSNGIYNQFKENLDASIATVEASFDSSNETDFGTQINTLKDCQFIFMPIYYTPASIFMTQAIGKVADDAIYYGCDGFDGIDSAEGFDITTIPQKVSMLSHFDSNATEGRAAEFINKYTEKYGKETLNQFGASAYDCVYALYNAMKQAIENGKEITPDTEASDLCEILKEVFQGGFEHTTGVTGTEDQAIAWNEDGTVVKEAVAYIIKEANA